MNKPAKEKTESKAKETKELGTIAYSTELPSKPEIDDESGD